MAKKIKSPVAPKKKTFYIMQIISGDDNEIVECSTNPDALKLVRFGTLVKNNKRRNEKDIIAN